MNFRKNQRGAEKGPLKLAPLCLNVKAYILNSSVTVSLPPPHACRFIVRMQGFLWAWLFGSFPVLLCFFSGIQY